MIKRIFFIITGILLCSYSIMFIVIYLNLLKMGYTFIGYIKYISSSIECLLLIPGIIILIKKKKKKYKTK